MFKFTGKRPTNLGVTNGRLAPPPRKPNCVSSQADPAVAAMKKLRALVEGMARTKVIESRADEGTVGRCRRHVQGACHTKPGLVRFWTEYQTSFDEPFRGHVTREFERKLPERSNLEEVRIVVSVKVSRVWTGSCWAHVGPFSVSPER